MFKLKILFVALLIFLCSGLVFIYNQKNNNNLFQVVLADDDDDDDDEDDDDDDGDDSKIKYKTIYTQLPDTVVYVTKKVPRYDGDSDGMYDDVDPHPTINDFFIVKDDNLNGLDDQYEKYKL